MVTLEQSVQNLAETGEAKPGPLPPLPPRVPNMQVFESGRIERAQPDAYKPLPDCKGLLVRELQTPGKYCGGRMAMRMLKVDPSGSFRQPAEASQFHGVRTLYIWKGEARYEIEGLDEVHLDTGAFVCLPPNNRHRLVAASPDLEVVEVEFPMLMATDKKTWSPKGADCATEAMIDRITPHSFEAIPNFNGAIERYMRILQEMTGGAVKVAVLKANPPHIWDGSPWHIHHNDFIGALFINGTGVMGYEEYGDLPLKEGDFFIQQGEIRHREVVMSRDFAILAFEAPAKTPTTVLLYDKEKGEHRTMLFTSAQDAGEAFD